ncbi:MAG: thioredoxin domain-containing protein, partial [Terrimesophilobacter sp.]
MAKKDSQRIIDIREKANRRRLEQQRSERRKTVIIQAGIVVGILLVVGAIVGGVLLAQGNRTQADPPSADGTISLQGTAGTPFAVGGTAVIVGKKDAPVTIDLYEDYSCPHCADYEAAVGPTLLALAAKGDAVVSFHPIRIVTAYGTAAGSAAACVAAKDAQNWPDFHSALFANHSQASDGWSAKDFANFANSFGVTDKDALTCITESRYIDWIESNTTASRDA